MILHDFTGMPEYVLHQFGIDLSTRFLDFMDAAGENPPQQARVALDAKRAWLSGALDDDELRKAEIKLINAGFRDGRHWSIHWIAVPDSNASARAPLKRLLNIATDSDAFLNDKNEIQFKKELRWQKNHLAKLHLEYSWAPIAELIFLVAQQNVITEHLIPEWEEALFQ